MLLHFSLFCLVSSICIFHFYPWHLAVTVSVTHNGVIKLHKSINSIKFGKYFIFCNLQQLFLSTKAWECGKGKSCHGANITSDRDHYHRLVGNNRERGGAVDELLMEICTPQFRDALGHSTKCFVFFNSRKCIFYTSNSSTAPPLEVLRCSASRSFGAVLRVPLCAVPRVIARQLIF